MLKAVILDYQSFAPDDLMLDVLWGLPIEWTVYDYTDKLDTASRVADQNIILSNKVVIDENILRNNSQLKLIIIMATGTNNVDLQVAKVLNIPVCHIIDYSTESVVQHTFSFMLALHSRLIEYDRSVRQGDWCHSRFFGLLDYPVRNVAGKTLGIIGYGAIGRRIEQVAKVLGMRVLVAESLVAPSVSQSLAQSTPQSAHTSQTREDIKNRRVPLSILFAESDVITIHCPLSPYSENLIDASAFAQMKPEAILLNMARGGIVNEQALVKALKEGVIGGAATDVLTQEPPSPNHIMLDQAIPHLIITPHTAWSSQESRQAMINQAIDILQSFMQDKLINQVKPI